MTERVWVPDRSWEVLPPDTAVKCRAESGPGHKKCGARAVAVLYRHSFARAKNYPWGYCAAHLYGRRLAPYEAAGLANGQVLTDVHPDSPAARRGYVERQP